MTYTKEDQIKVIRALKAAQTETIQQGLMIGGLIFNHDGDSAEDLTTRNELQDVLVTAENHAQALEHVIKRFESP